MESVAARRVVSWPGSLPRPDWGAISTWALACSLVLYLGFDGGGSDIVVRSQVGIAVWWIVLVGAAFGVLPQSRLARVAWAGLAVFGGFVVWTAIASTWSLSSESSLQELSRIAAYLGVLLLAIAIHRNRATALRHTVNAVGASIAVIALFALISRLFPNSFPASHVVSTFLGGAQGRLSWPLNYWNGLAALVAFGAPLLLASATSARSLIAQAIAAGALPMMALCGYLTFSRGGAIASAVAVFAFVALAPNRIPKLATLLAAAGGGAILIVGALHRHAVENGLTNHLATVQGKQLALAVVIVCVGVAIVQVGIGLAARHGTLPRLLTVPPPRAQVLLAAGIVLVLVVALAAGAPSRLSHTWTDFKNNKGVSSSALPARFGSASGNGRYQYWSVAVHAAKGHALDGWGPGTFQLVWLPRATPVGGYVINAHSLYVETLSDVGVVGVVLLVGFLILCVGAAVWVVAHSKRGTRTRAAGVAAAMLAFMTSAIFEWVWQIPVLPVAFMLLAAAVFAPAPRRVSVGAIKDPARSNRIGRARSRSGQFIVRAGMVVAAIACLVAISVPLATTNDVRRSQAAVAGGNTALALTDAHSAARIEPGAASPQLQTALVLELQHNVPAALVAARNATHDEPQNWTGWLILSRLEAEAGHARASVAAYNRARLLNPHSSLFPQQ